MAMIPDKREKTDPFPTAPPDTPRQARVSRLVEQGHTLTDAVGLAASAEAGFEPLPTHGQDEPRPRPKGVRR